MILSREDDKRRDRPPLGINRLNDCRPFSITRLCHFSPSTSFRSSDYHSRGDNAHHEASLVKVVGVIIRDPVLKLNLLYKLKPCMYYIWIFTLGSLVVILSSKSRRKL